MHGAPTQSRHEIDFQMSKNEDLKKKIPNEDKRNFSMQTLVHSCALLRRSPSCHGPAF
jgi:hypothetical protein